MSDGTTIAAAFAAVCLPAVVWVTFRVDERLERHPRTNAVAFAVATLLLLLRFVTW